MDRNREAIRPAELSDGFNARAKDRANRENRGKPRRKRPAPFSIRLSEGERARLAVEAAGAPLGAYVKAKVFGTPPLRLRRSGLSIQDRTALAQLLALLGRSRIANNLNQLAWAVNIGSLPVTPETEQDLCGAVMAVRDMRTLLMTALGHKAGDAP